MAWDGAVPREGEDRAKAGSVTRPALACTQPYLCVYLCVQLYVCICVCVCVYECVCIVRARTCVCVCVCVCVCPCMRKTWHLEGRGCVDCMPVW